MNTAVQTQFRYDPFSAEAMRDPHRLYPVLREEQPAYFIPEYDTWVFSRYQDVWDGFMDTGHFSEAEGQLFAREALLEHHRGHPPEPKLEPEKAMYLWLDPPVQTRFRQALAGPFLKGSIAKLAPTIRETVRGRLTELLLRGEFDLNADFASYVTVRITAAMMGLQIEDPATVVDLIARMVARAPGEAGSTADGGVAREELHAILCAEVRRRRDGIGPPSAAIDPLLLPGLIGRPLTDSEIASDIAAMLFGGTETVPKVLAGGLLELATRPDQLAEVRADPQAHAATAWEEMLRYNAPAQWFGRTAKAEVELGGARILPGQRVILLIASANRDPREFHDADAFIWNRRARRMLSFGLGAHFCIGIHLARLEGAILLEEFLASVPSFELLTAKGAFAQSEFQIGWTSLTVRIGR